MKPVTRAMMKPTVSKMKKQEAKWQKDDEEEQMMAEIFYEDGGAPTKDERGGGNWDLVKDKVSKDLGVPFHKIGLKDFEEWRSRGFKRAKKGEYLDITPEERNHFLDMLCGCALRK